MLIQEFSLYGLLLVATSLSFTFVSRARNSGSLKRHVIAALASNGVWFTSQLATVAGFNKILSGELGLRFAIGVGIYYTLCTVAGSVLAHWLSLRTEKGQAAVGASALYAQIPVDEWERVKQRLSELGIS